jgi:hypothetical protein
VAAQADAGVSIVHVATVMGVAGVRVMCGTNTSIAGFLASDGAWGGSDGGECEEREDKAGHRSAPDNAFRQFPLL